MSATPPVFTNSPQTGFLKIPGQVDIPTFTFLPAIDAGNVETEKRKRVWRERPDLWAEERLNEKLWSKQREIMLSVAGNRKTAVMSCHEIGKSFIAARIAGWWIDIWPVGSAYVVTTAPTFNQVKNILWKEIGRARAQGQLPGETNQTEWRREMPWGVNEAVAIGRKPADHAAHGFQGIHAPHVLVIVDEACGVRGLWPAIESLIANKRGKLLAIGNPDDPETEFKQICTPDSGYNTIQIGAFDTPNFTGEELPEFVLDQLIDETYVEDMRRKWAPTWKWNKDRTSVDPPLGESREDGNPFWLSKVLGLFPKNSVDGGLLNLHWILEAQRRELGPGEPIELGVDVGAGGDSSTTAARRGPVVRILSEDHNPDTMETCGKVVSERRDVNATLVKVDTIGIGKGITDRGIEMNEPFVGINVGEKAIDSEGFANLKAEYWWGIRERFEAGDIDLDPEDERTAGELASIRYKRKSNGQIIIESKDEAKRRGVPSPNRAEAVMLAYATPPEREPEGGLVF